MFDKDYKDIFSVIVLMVSMVVLVNNYDNIFVVSGISGLFSSLFLFISKNDKECHLFKRGVFLLWIFFCCFWIILFIGISRHFGIEGFLFTFVGAAIAYFALSFLIDFITNIKEEDEYF
ncbi:MAG: hypothetical protein AAGB12_16025 [Pseudomonadota bacterium]